MVVGVIKGAQAISKGIGSLDRSLKGLVKRVETAPTDKSPFFPYITNEKELEYKVFLGRGEKPGKLTRKQNDIYLDQHFAKVNEDPNFGRFSMDVIRQPIDDPKKLQVGKTIQEKDHMPITLSRINKFGADEVSEASVQSPFAKSTSQGRKNLTTILKVKNNPDDVPLPKPKGRFADFDHKLGMTQEEKIAAGITTIPVKKNTMSNSLIRQYTDSLLKKIYKLNPETNLKDRAPFTALTHQARGLYQKDPDNFFKNLQNKDKKLINNLDKAKENYTPELKELYEEKDRLTSPGSKTREKLVAIARKFMPNASEDYINKNLVDFAHVFGFDATGDVSRQSKFLDIGGSPDVMYLSPSYANRTVQVQLEKQIKNLITANRVKPDPKLEESVNRLQKLLEKIKAVSYITMDNRGVIDTAKFGYTAKVTKGKYKAPRFTDDEYEELFEYLLEAQPNIQNTLQKKSPYKGVLFKDGGLIDSDLTDTVPPKKGPMSEGLPLLDPQESIDRQKFAIGGIAGAAKLFGQMKNVQKAVARVGDILKQKGTPGKATDVAISQAPEDKPAMFLSTVDAIEDMPETSLPAKQWLGTIKNKQGVSDVELDEFGLGPLLENIAKTDAKRKLSKTELLELYNKEMPKIDMDIAMAEPVSRGVKDLTNTLLRTRELRGNRAYSDDNLDVFSDNPALLNRLHQPPQDATGMKIRRLLIDNMQGSQIQEGDNMIPLLKKSYGGRSFELYTGNKFNDMWGNTFPKLYHGTNKIVKQDHFNVLKNLVPARDVTKLAQAKNIPEDQAFNELYQALNIFDREVMTADVPIPFWTKKMLYRMGDMADGRGFFYKSKKSPAHDGAQFIPGGSGYGELKFYHNFDTGAVRAREKKYDSGHFSNEGFEGKGGNAPFGWGRFSERIDENGRKILLMEEVQSDLHQNVAQKGYIYAPRLDKGDVLAEMGDFASQLDKKRQTLESTRLRKDNILALPRAEREAPENVAELANIERAMKKLVEDVKKLQKKVQEQARTTGSSGQMHQEAPFKKSENYAKVFLQGLMKMADDSGYDGIALSTGKMKKAHGNIPKGGDKFYDEIGVKAMKRIAKKSGFKFTDTTIVDGNGFTWEKIPLIELRDFNTGVKYPGSSTIPVYSKGGFVKQNVVRG